MILIIVMRPIIHLELMDSVFLQYEMLGTITGFERVTPGSDRDPTRASEFKLRMFRWYLVTQHQTRRRVTNQDQCGCLCVFKTSSKHLMRLISRPVI